MKFIALSTFTAGAGVAKGRKFTKGEVISEKLYSRLESSLKRRFEAVEPKAKGRVLYTLEEKLLIIELYLEHFNLDGTVDSEAIFSEFHLTFPDRCFNSVKKLVYAIQSRDAFCPQVGLTSVATDVAEALHAYDSERFPLTVDRPTKVEALIENLLTQIRLEG